MLTSTSELGNYSLSVLTDPSIRLCSVYKTILPPAPRIQHGFQQLLFQQTVKSQSK